MFFGLLRKLRSSAGYASFKQNAVYVFQGSLPEKLQTEQISSYQAGQNTNSLGYSKSTAPLSFLVG